MNVYLCIDTFDLGTSEQKARKVCEEATEFFAEHAYGSLENLCMEVGDVYTAITNYCAQRGIDPQYCIDLANAKNIIRGRYDKMFTGEAPALDGDSREVG